MSQTFDAYQEALEREVKNWNGYERVLRGDNKKFFGVLKNMTRGYVSEGSSAEKNVVFQPMVMSIILAQDKRMRRIEDALKRIKPPQVTQVEEKKPVEPAFNKPKPKTS
jgi:hypothetical protein